MPYAHVRSCTVSSGAATRDGRLTVGVQSGSLCPVPKHLSCVVHVLRDAIGVYRS